MDTGVLPGRGTQVSPPSRVERASEPSFSMRVCSTTSRSSPSSPTRHTPRATLPLSVTVLPSR